MQIYTRYTEPTKRPRPSSDFRHGKNATTKTDERVSRTKQSDHEASDINAIVKKGILSTGMSSNRQAMYGDFSNGDDFLTAQTKVAQFKGAFEALPSHIRNKFSNQPEAYLDYMKNPANKEEAVSLGLLPKPVYTTEKLLNPEGFEEVVSYKDGVEIGRRPLKATSGNSATPGPTPGEAT